VRAREAASQAGCHFTAGCRGTRRHHHRVKLEQLLERRDHQRSRSETQRPRPKCAYVYVTKYLHLAVAVNLTAESVDWPPETPAIEIMGHEGTHAPYIDLMMKRCAEHGFDPFHVRSQSMGYLYNRYDNFSSHHPSTPKTKKNLTMTFFLQDMGGNQERGSPSRLRRRRDTRGARCDFQGRAEDSKGPLRADGYRWARCRPGYRGALR
jgi:hypothetical protein